MIATPILLLALIASPRPAEMCGVCHSDVRVTFQASVHAVEGIRCSSCHGGDPSATTVAAAHRGDFRGVPRRRDTPALCASCHADIARMRPYNLPTDQLALYQTSRHGRKLAEGDDRVAVCTDCHGAHDIRGRSDPQSRVFPANIPATCARCHADAALMARFGLKATAFDDYSKSVHGKAFLVKGDRSAPECTRCHGSHGATPPGVGDVDKVCGQCHATTRAFFLQGPHKQAMEAAGLPECASCHDHHQIQAAGPALLDTACLKCHDQDSDQVRLAQTFKTLFAGAAEEIDRARILVDRAAAVPFYVEDYRARLEEARTSLTESYPAMHALAVTPVRDLTAQARGIAREVESEVEAKLKGLGWRRVGLLVFWFYLLLTVAVLARFRRRAAQEPR
jgi:predicted CXXCH cytochrome family protein